MKQIYQKSFEVLPFILLELEDPDDVLKLTENFYIIKNDEIFLSSLSVSINFALTGIRRRIFHMYLNIYVALS